LKNLVTLLCLVGAPVFSFAQSQEVAFLSQMTSDVVQACRVQSGQSVNGSPPNSVGFTLIMPGGNGGYPAFWVRDFAMSLDSGFITALEMSNQLQLVAQAQNGSNALNLANGLIVPPYAIPDHIEFNGAPTYYPGTYATGDDQGDGSFGLLPPADDHYWFVHIAYCLFRAQGDTDFLSVPVNGMTMLDRLVAAFNAPTTDPQTGLFETTATNRAVGFGFCDGIYFTGKILFPSVLRYQAAGELAALYQALGQPDAATPYLRAQSQISSNLPATFAGLPNFGGWLMAATDIGQQADVWGTLYALHTGALTGNAAKNARAAVISGVTNQTIVYDGAVRHVPSNLDYSTSSAWQQTGEALNTYQNGAYWHTPTGWLIEAVYQTNTGLASDIFAQYVQYLQANDYRLGQGPQAPWECFYPPTGYVQNGVYMTSVTAPYAVISNMIFSVPPTAPSITVTSPSSLSLATYVGNAPVFQLQTFVSGTTPLSYQWQQDGGLGGAFFNTPGVSTNNLAIKTTGLPPGNYRYQLVVTNSVGAATSSIVTMAIVPVPAAPAQGIAWGPAVGITGDSDVNTNGIGLYAFGMTLAPVTVNTVQFTEFDPSYTGGFFQNLAADSQIANGGVSLLTASHGYYYFNAFGGGASAPFSTLSANYQNLLSCGIGEDPGGADIWQLSFTNLIPGLEYEIELWSDDSRGAQAGTTEILSDLSGTNATGSLTVAAGSGTPGELGTYVIGTANADTNGAITVLVNNGVDPSGQPTLQINAFQLRLLPPSLNVAFASANIRLSWTGPGLLQQAPTPTGPWTTTNGAVSPFRIVPSASQQFYRLKLQ
jgi:hypothetical protein